MTTLDALVDDDLLALINAVLDGHTCRDDRDLWRKLTELGLADLTGRDQRGGSGATWREGAALVRALAQQGCSLPVGESDLVAGWLLDQADLDAPQALRDWLLDDGSASETHPLAERIVAVRREPEGWQLADAAATDVMAWRDAGGWPESLAWHRIEDSIVLGARARAALVRSVQITGAMETVLSFAIDHARTRQQFGRPIGRFQAVQQLVATLAAETALARAATDAAVLVAADADAGPDRLLPAVATARSCAGHAAEPVVRNAHQVIGAIGTTREHRLHEFTTLILDWRSADRGTLFWDKQVLEYALAGVPLTELDLTRDCTTE